MKIPIYDHHLMLKAELNRDGRNWHNIATWMSAYKSEFVLAEMNGWNDERIQRLKYTEKKLRTLLIS